MADASLVKIGVCNVEFDGVDLGYTKDFVKVRYSAETNEIEVDQMDTPIDEIITKQTFEVEVPMAETNLQRLADLLPGATLTTGAGADAGEYSLELSGAAGGSLLSLGKKLVLKPTASDADEHDWLTLFKAVPVPSMDYSYEKEGVRVFTITFKAVPDPDSTPANRWVLWGDENIATS